MEEKTGVGVHRLRGPIGVLVAAGILVALAGAAGWVLLGLIQASPSGQLEIDCVRDLQAISDALANADAGRLQDAATGNAILALTDQVTEEQRSGLRTQESRKLSSIQVVQATDPGDSSITQAVEEKGTLTRTITASGSQSTEQRVAFDNRYWLRAPTGPRYAITDQLVSEQAISGVEPGALGWVLGVAVLAAVAAAAVGIRQRVRKAATAAPISTPPPANVESSGHSRQPRLRIETFGGLRVWVGGSDLGPKLKRHPMLYFIWVWLLLRAVHYDRPAVFRGDLADEAYPGSNPDTQRTRLRGRLSETRTKLPPELGAAVLVEGDFVRLDLADCWVDLVELGRVTEKLGSDLASATDPLMQVGLRLFRAGQGRILPEWDGIAWQIARGRGGADQLIRDVRATAQLRQAQLGRLLEEGYRSRGESELAALIRAELRASSGVTD